MYGGETLPLEPSDFMDARVEEVYDLLTELDDVSVQVTWAAPLAADPLGAVLGCVGYLGPGSMEAPVYRRVYIFRITAPYAVGHKLLHKLHDEQFDVAATVVDLAETLMSPIQEVAGPSQTEDGPSLTAPKNVGVNAEDSFKYRVACSIPYRQLDFFLATVKELLAEDDLLWLSKYDWAKMGKFAEVRYGIPNVHPDGWSDADFGTLHPVE